MPEPKVQEFFSKVQNGIDTYLPVGTGSYTGSDFGKTLAGNGYVHSMVPAAIVGAGTGALLSALTGRSVLGGAGLGLGLGAGLGALHQTLYDKNKDYAFNNPFTKFVEWMTVPKDANGAVNIYDYIRDNVLKVNKDDKLPVKLFKNFGHMVGANGKMQVAYDDLRDYLANTNDTNLVDEATNYFKYPGEPIPLNIPADKIRPHHLYYPAFLLRQQK